MALSRFVVTALVTVTPDALATPTAGLPGTGGAAGFGSSATIVPAAGSEGKYGLPGMPLTFHPGDVIYADSAAGFATGAQLLYQAIGSANLRAYVQGQDDVGHAALAN
jgi:hypothetical protein